MSEKKVITIASIRPPGEGKKSAMVTTTDGEKLWLWRDKLGLVNQGGTYEAVIEENNGFKNIKTVKQVAAAPLASRDPFVSGAYRQPAAPPAAFRTPEQMFVSEVLAAYIGNGRCEPEKLSEIVTFIRRAYNVHWGPEANRNTFYAGEAGHAYQDAAE